MFRPTGNQQDTECLDVFDVFVQVSGIIADLAEQHIKSRSSLPCSWFTARECIATSYQELFSHLPNDVKETYQEIYAELAFFVDDDVFDDFNSARAFECNVLRELEKKDKKQCSERLDRFRKIVAGATSISRREIRENLLRHRDCPSEHLLTIAETLSYCRDMYQAMWDEWAAFTNFLLYRNNHEVLASIVDRPNATMAAQGGNR